MNFLVGEEAKLFEYLMSIKNEKNQFSVNWALVAEKLGKTRNAVRTTCARFKKKGYIKSIHVPTGRNSISTYEIDTELENGYLFSKKEFFKTDSFDFSKPPKKSTFLQFTNLYFISNEKETMVKIGISDNVDKRLRQHQTSSLGEKLKIMRVINNIPAALEKEIHEEFKHLRKEGEWFLLKKELKMYIEYMRIPECLLSGNEYK